MLRTDAIGQGCRSRRPHAPHVAGLCHRPRHQGRELAADRRLPREAWSRPSVRSHQCQVGRLQPAPRSATRRVGGPRRAERRRRSRRSRRFARQAQSLGENEPFAARRRHPACPLRRRGEDARRCRRLPIGSAPSDRSHPEGDDDNAASRSRRLSSRRGVDRARTSQQERQRALGRPVHRHVVPGPLSRPGGGGGDAPLRLADRRPHRRREAGDALPGGSAIGHIPDEAAHPAGAEPDRPAPDRRSACARPAASRADDARRVSSSRPARLLRERARFHGGLRPEVVPHRPVAEPDREGLWPEQCDPRQLPCAGELRDQ